MSHQEIWAVPFFGQGHLLPSIELFKQIASRSFKATLVITSNLSSSIPSSLILQYPLIRIAELPSKPTLPPPPPPPEQPGIGLPHHHHKHEHRGHMCRDLENLISTRLSQDNSDSKLPICALVDVMMSWTAETFKKFDIPVVGFFTSGACSDAMDYAVWMVDRKLEDDLMPGELFLLPGLPEDMALSYLDLKRSEPPHGHGPPPHPGSGDGRGTRAQRMGPSGHGDRAPWMVEAKGSIGFMINTCDDLERPFIDYIADQVSKPVWGVGPLLPEQYWNRTGNIVHDHEFRANRRTNVTEEEVIGWLDSKPRGSVLYVSFGSEVAPSMEQYPYSADALEASDRPIHLGD